MTYTIEELEAAWERYIKDFKIRYLIKGEWKLFDTAQKGLEATRAEKVRTRDVLSFIDFLKEL